MMAIVKTFLLLQVFVTLFLQSSSYPIYGTKSNNQNYPDDYYYSQDPIYYPRTSKYEVYQAVLPYYYQRPSYGGYYYQDPMQEEMIQEAERQEREEAQPIGHELLYENESGDDLDGLDDVNAAFLQNLIVSQMYKDSVDNKDYFEDYYPTEDYPKQEDKDVKELKQLAKPKNKSRKNKNKAKENDDDIHWLQREQYRKQQKRTEDKETFSTTPIPSIKRGQKEEVLMRPATPVRHPFSNAVLDNMLSKDDNRKRGPSVYDTIKHMLDMEKSLEKHGSDSIRPNNMKKRTPIISSEESLTKQLSVLKKTQ